MILLTVSFFLVLLWTSFTVGCYIIVILTAEKYRSYRNSCFLDDSVCSCSLCVCTVCWWLFAEMHCKNKLLSRYHDFCVFL